MTKRKSERKNVSLSIESQLRAKERQRRRFDTEGTHDGRPKDAGDLLDALRKHHPEHDPDKEK